MHDTNGTEIKVGDDVLDLSGVRATVAEPRPGGHALLRYSDGRTFEWESYLLLKV